VISKLERGNGGVRGTFPNKKRTPKKGRKLWAKVGAKKKRKGLEAFHRGAGHRAGAGKCLFERESLGQQSGGGTHIREGNDAKKGGERAPGR